MKITVHIERVVLDGVPGEHPRVLRNSLEHELAEQLRLGGVASEFRRGAAVPCVAGGAIKIVRDPSAAGLGTQIARAVYRGIGGRR